MGRFRSAALPAAAFRIPFFAAVSLAGIVSIIGLVPAAWLLAVGLGLIAVAHLPVHFGARVVLLLVAGCALLALRANPRLAPPLAALWPVIASMFMFRMMVYMYDLRHRAAPFSLAHALAYLFMLPNVFFPLFPVVDYKTFCRSHYSAEATAVYQKGIERILRGVVHLLFYRLIYQNFVLSAAEVISAGQAAQFMLTTFLRYLQVSGNYHLIVGMLCLFGFNLPEAFNRWFLASSFADFWRRANIYWKDFMQKIFFTPVLFLTKGRLGETGALLLATAATMFVTWALHDYQTFGISGKYAPRVQDMVFWSFLGAMILVNVYTEARFGRKRSLKNASWSIGEDIATGLRVATMVVVIMTAWNYWSASSVTEFVSVVSVPRHYGARGARDRRGAGADRGGGCARAPLSAPSEADAAERFARSAQVLDQRGAARGCHGLHTRGGQVAADPLAGFRSGGQHGVCTARIEAQPARHPAARTRLLRGPHRRNALQQRTRGAVRRSAGRLEQESDDPAEPGALSALRPLPVDAGRVQGGTDEHQLLGHARSRVSGRRSPRALSAWCCSAPRTALGLESPTTRHSKT